MFLSIHIFVAKKHTTLRFKIFITWNKKERNENNLTTETGVAVAVGVVAVGVVVVAVTSVVVAVACFLRP